MTSRAALLAALVAAAALAVPASAASPAAQITTYVSQARAVFEHQILACAREARFVDCLLNHLNDYQQDNLNMVELFNLRLALSGSAACRSQATGTATKLSAATTVTYRLISDVVSWGDAGYAPPASEWRNVASKAGVAAAAVAIYRHTCLP